MEEQATENAHRSLTQEQVTHFHQRGYLRIGKLLEDEHIEELRAEYDRIFVEARESERYRNLSATEDDTGNGGELVSSIVGSRSTKLTGWATRTPVVCPGYLMINGIQI